MQKDTKTVFFGFAPFDYKAMGQYMEEMALKGWELTSIGRYTATFKAVPPRARKCFVDVYTEAMDGENREKNLREYKKKWARQGMKLAGEYDFFYYFYSTSETANIPEKGDAEAEFNLMQRSVWRKEWTAMLILVFVMAFSGITTIQMSVARLYNFTGLASLMLFPLTIIPFILISFYLLKWIFSIRKYWKKKEPFPISVLKEAQLRYRLFYGFIAVIMTIATAAVIGDAVVNYPLPVMFGCIIAAGVIILGVLTKSKNHKNKVPALILAAVLLCGSVIANYARISDCGTRKSLPPTAIALKMSDLKGTKAEIINSEYKPTKSFVIPKRFVYMEILSDGSELSTEYYDTLDDKVSEYVYKKLCIAIDKKREVTPLDYNVFNAEAVSVDGENAVLIRWKDKVMFAELKDKSGNISGLYEAINRKFMR